MASPIATKTSKDKKTEQAQGRLHEFTRQPALPGPQAEVLNLQRIAGNRTVSMGLQSGGSTSLLGESPIPPIVHEVLRLPGQPLDPATRISMEAKFGTDFRDVRVHTDSLAADSTRELDADAYTVGKNIVFGEKKYAPKTLLGKQLLAHELIHVMHQPSRILSTLTLGRPDDVGEQQADYLANAIMKRNYRGRPFRIHRRQHPKEEEIRGAGGDLMHGSNWGEASLQGIQHAPSYGLIQRKLHSEEHPRIRRLNHLVQMELDRADGGSYKVLLQALITAHKLGGVNQLVKDLRARRHKKSGTYFGAFLQAIRSKGGKGILQSVMNILTSHAITVHEAPQDIGLISFTKESIFSKIGTELERISTPVILQHLLGGVVGVIEGFASALYESGVGIVKGAWSLAIAIDHVKAAIDYLILRGIEKLPGLGKYANSEPYREKYERTVHFLRSIGNALTNPSKIIRAIKIAASRAWKQVEGEYNKADEFNKGRIVAKGVVKVGMAVVGVVKSLPTLFRVARKAGRILGSAGRRLSQRVLKARPLPPVRPMEGPPAPKQLTGRQPPPQLKEGPLAPKQLTEGPPAPKQLTEGSVPLESLSEGQTRLTKEFQPKIFERRGSKKPLPETTRTEKPFKTLGYRETGPRKPHYTGKRPKLETSLDFVWSLSKPERHHFWSTYLRGLKSQTLRALPRSLHHHLHTALDKWKNGIFSRLKSAAYFKNTNPNEIIVELRQFYEKAEGGLFKEYLPDFEHAVEETLAAMGKSTKT
jgi:hypothetical protein